MGSDKKYSLEICARIGMVREPEGAKITQASDVAAAMESIRNADREMVYVLTLDGGGRIIDRHLVSLGSVNSSSVHPRDVFRPAIADNAVSVILAHNHPSGNVEPSMADIEITRRVKEAGDILQIKVLDHVIIGRGEYSFALEGRM